MSKERRHFFCPLLNTTISHLLENKFFSTALCASGGVDGEWWACGKEEIGPKTNEIGGWVAGTASQKCLFGCTFPCIFFFGGKKGRIKARLLLKSRAGDADAEPLFDRSQTRTFFIFREFVMQC